MLLPWLLLCMFWRGGLPPGFMTVPPCEVRMRGGGGPCVNMPGLLMVGVGGTGGFNTWGGGVVVSSGPPGAPPVAGAGPVKPIWMVPGWLAFHARIAWM